MERFPLGKLHPSLLRKFVYSAYSTFDHEDIVPVSHLEDNLYLLETFHGPTASFKDVALQLTPQFLSYASENFPIHSCGNRSDGAASRALDLALLVATSGDTGVAALHGFRRQGIPVSVLYPQHGVSRVQRHQVSVQTQPYYGAVKSLNQLL